MHVGKGIIYFDQIDPSYPLCPHHREDVITCERVEGCEAKCAAVVLLEVGSAEERREALEDELMDLMGRQELNPGEVKRSYTCPWCSMTSYHPEDIRHEYCGNCHKTREELMVQDAAPIVRELKERARDRPWAPTSDPPREHFHMLPSGLSICFTQDILEEAQYWHLSITRFPGDLTAQEIDFWRRAFFRGEPNIECAGRFSDGMTKSFYWEVECG